MTILIMAAAGLISVNVTAAVTLAAVFHRRSDNRQAAYKVLSLLLRHRTAIKTARYDALATVGRPTRKDTDPAGCVTEHGAEQVEHVIGYDTPSPSG